MITAVTVKASRKADRKAPRKQKSGEIHTFDCTRTRMRVKVNNAQAVGPKKRPPTKASAFVCGPTNQNTPKNQRSLPDPNSNTKSLSTTKLAKVRQKVMTFWRWSPARPPVTARHPYLPSIATLLPIDEKKTTHRNRQCSFGTDSWMSCSISTARDQRLYSPSFFCKQFRLDARRIERLSCTRKG